MAKIHIIDNLSSLSIVESMLTRSNRGGSNTTTIKQSSLSSSSSSPKRNNSTLFSFTMWKYCFIGIIILVALMELHLFQSVHNNVRSNTVNNNNDNEEYNTEQILINNNNNNNAVDAIAIDNNNNNNISKKDERCAINFWGLPRAFKSLVLPSIVKNIIQINPGCDYYIHYYYKTEEAAGRSGQGGEIDPNEILLLKDAIIKEVAKTESNNRKPIIEFIYDTEDDFWKLYTPLIEKIRTTKDPKTGKYLYFPWKAKTYQHPVTTDNIIKMWHSIQSVYQLMEKSAIKNNIQYTTVAMFRSDVVYITPINIHDNGENNNVVTVPDFGKYPVSDRIIYGPSNAVKIWSTERFNHLEQHVQYIQQYNPGWGMHSERFINTTIFPLIIEKQSNIIIRPHPTLCFLRARADESIWINDCTVGPASVSSPSIAKALGTDIKHIIENTIGRKCSGEITKPRRNVISMNCRSITKTDVVSS